MKNKSEGVLTASFYDIINNEPYDLYTWERIISRIRNAIKQYGQVPQISFNNLDFLDDLVEFWVIMTEDLTHWNDYQSNIRWEMS